MFTLFNFYRSKEWALLLIQLKHERLNKEGQLICEYCGKPIIKAYDCIGHHKEHLTEENVNDYNISLNGDNVTLVHHKCHNRIHNKLGYADRHIYMVHGSPLAGKYTYVESVREPGDLIVDVDNIWECVSGCERYIKPPRLNAIVFGIRDRLLEDVKYRHGKWRTAYIIGSYPLISERERLCKALGASEIHIDTSEEECIKRLECIEDMRKEKYEEYEEYIKNYWQQYTPPSN